MRVGINGFGRIGRCLLRLAAQDPDLEVVAVNDLMPVETALHLFKYDSVHGRFDEARLEGDSLVAGRQKVKILSEPDPKKLPWKDLGVDLVIESTGRFRKRSAAAQHLEAGAKRVVISAPADSKDQADGTFVCGVNLETYDPAKHVVVSNASCTTNCLAPIVKVLHDTFKILDAQMTTIHSYTNDQRILDFPHKDLRRARAAALSMIPTTTGAARAIGLVIPELQGKIDGMAIRVPTPNVSVVDLVARVERVPSGEQEVLEAMKKAAEGPMKGILGVEEEPLVSTDFNGDVRSSIVDAPSIKVVGNLVKVLSWYDNEMGYSARVWDLAKHMASKGL